MNWLARGNTGEDMEGRESGDEKAIYVGSGGTCKSYQGKKGKNHKEGNDPINKSLSGNHGSEGWRRSKWGAIRLLSKGEKGTESRGG